MTEHPTITVGSPSGRIRPAQLACLFLGVSCLAWGLAPAVIERVITGRAPRADSLIFGSLTLVVGAAFMVLHFAVRRGRRGGMWAAFVLALIILAFSLPSVIAHPRSVAASFMPVLATCVAFTNWLALKRERVAAVCVSPSWKDHPGVSHLLPSATPATHLNDNLEGAAQIGADAVSEEAVLVAASARDRHR